MKYKPALNNSYLATHIIHRKGGVNIKPLKIQSLEFLRHFDKFPLLDKIRKAIDLGRGLEGLAWRLNQNGYMHNKVIDKNPEKVKLTRQLVVRSLALG